jgi:hypothetical protein
MAQESADDLAHLTDEERAVVVKVIEVLRKLKFGTVLLVVQDGKVVQIEMAEKIRLRYSPFRDRLVDNAGTALILMGPFG